MNQGGEEKEGAKGGCEYLAGQGHLKIESSTEKEFPYVLSSVIVARLSKTLQALLQPGYRIHSSLPWDDVWIATFNRKFWRGLAKSRVWLPSGVRQEEE